MEELTKRIERLYKEQGHKQSSFAKAINKNQGATSKLLSGKRPINRDCARDMAKALNQSLEELLRGTDHEFLLTEEIEMSILDETRKDLATTQAENEMLRAENAGIKEENALLKERPTTEEVTGLKELVAQQQQQNADLQKRLDEVTKALHAEQVALVLAQKAKNVLDQMVNQFSVDKVLLQNQVKDSERKINRQQRQIDFLQEKLSTAQEQANRYQQASKRLSEAKSSSNALAILLGLGLLGTTLSITKK